MAEEMQLGEMRPERPQAEPPKPEEAKEGPGCFAIGLIVVLVVIVVAFGLIVGMCGIKL